MPALARASLATGPSFSIRFSAGAIGAASAAHCGSRPSVRCERGRRSVESRPAYFWCSASALYVAMSTPVGQSEAQPLQARQRSSASPTAGSASPWTSSPSSASWSTRERPRVESFSSRVARYDGHITPPGRGRDALADPGAAVHGVGHRAAVVGEPERRRDRQPRPGRAQVGVQRRRVDDVARVQQVLRVADRLHRAEQPDRLRVVHQRQQLRARPPVAVLPGQRAAVVAQLHRAGGQEVAERRCRRRRSGSRCARARSRRRSGRTAPRPGRTRAAARRSRAARRRGARAARPRPPSRSTPAWAGCGPPVRRRPRGSATGRPTRRGR